MLTVPDDITCEHAVASINPECIFPNATNILLGICSHPHFMSGLFRIACYALCHINALWCRWLYASWNSCQKLGSAKKICDWYKVLVLARSSCWQPCGPAFECVMQEKTSASCRRFLCSYLLKCVVFYQQCSSVVLQRSTVSMKLVKVACTQCWDATYIGFPASITVADPYTFCASCNYQCVETLPSVRSSTSLGLSVNTPWRKEMRYWRSADTSSGNTVWWMSSAFSFCDNRCMGGISWSMLTTASCSSKQALNTVQTLQTRRCSHATVPAAVPAAK